jgi:rhodanese-related sulfurtransferase
MLLRMPRTTNEHSVSCVNRSIIAVLIASLGSLILGGCSQSVTDKNIKVTSGSDVQQWLKTAEIESEAMLVVLVDPRPKAEYEEEHIAGAWHLTLPMVPIDRSPDAALDAYEKIVVYGNDPGSATAKALSKRLIANGYSGDIYLFAGGLTEWKAQGGKTQSGSDSRRKGPR